LTHLNRAKKKRKKLQELNKKDSLRIQRLRGVRYSLWVKKRKRRNNLKMIAPPTPILRTFRQFRLPIRIMQEIEVTWSGVVFFLIS
jgi:hypothetical protein